MPTNFAVTANPATVNAGGTSTIDVTCTLHPGALVTVTLALGATQEASTEVTIPAETFPVIKLAGDTTIGPTDLVLSASQGTLMQTGEGVYTLQL